MRKSTALVLVAFLVTGLVSVGIAVDRPGISDGEPKQNSADRTGPEEEEREVRSETNATEDGSNHTVREVSEDGQTTIARQNTSDGWFIDSASQNGLDYGNRTRTAELRRLVEGEFGVGAYVSDVNSDGWEDLLVISEGKPTLFKNNGGRFERSDYLPEIRANITSALFFDYDNDGWEDLYLLSDNRSIFFENTGEGFVEKGVGLGAGYRSVRGASAADYTGNGCLDVFVIQANDWTDTRPNGYNDRNVTVQEDNGNPNRLFRGDCERFEETTSKAGIRGEAWSLATSFVDFTNDGYPDIHIANDFNNDVLYINNGNGSFERKVLPESTNRNGMSSEVADINGDGFLDIFVSNIYFSPDGSGYGGATSVSRGYYEGRAKGNNLLINRGNGKFKDRARKYGVRRGGWGWSALMEDFDNDRHLELYQTTELEGMFWENNGTYRRVNSSVSGIGSISTKGAVAFDHDKTGELDIAEAVDPLAPNGEIGWIRFNENNFSTGNWIRIHISGNGSESTQMGTRVYVEDRLGTQMRVLHSNTGYLSQSSRVLHFGLGSVREIEELRVSWNSGGVKTYERVEVNTRYTISPKRGLRETP